MTILERQPSIPLFKLRAALEGQIDGETMVLACLWLESGESVIRKGRTESVGDITNREQN